MAKEYRDSTIQTLLEAHLDQLKKINEGIQSILVVQKEMKKELESMRPIKEEWPVVKLTIQDMNKRMKGMDNNLKIVNQKVDDLDKKVSIVLPSHEKRILRLEHKPA